MANKVRKTGVGFTQKPVFGNEPMYAVPVRIDVSETETAKRLEDAGTPGHKLLRAGTPLGKTGAKVLDVPNTVLQFLNTTDTQVFLAADVLVPEGQDEISASGVVKAVVYENNLPVTLDSTAKTAMKNCIFRKVQDNG